MQHGETVDNRCTTYILFDKGSLARWTFFRPYVRNLASF